MNRITSWRVIDKPPVIEMIKAEDGVYEQAKIVKIEYNGVFIDEILMTEQQVKNIYAVLGKKK